MLEDPAIINKKLLKKVPSGIPSPIDKADIQARWNLNPDDVYITASWTHYTL